MKNAKNINIGLGFIFAIITIKITVGELQWTQKKKKLKIEKNYLKNQ